MAQRKIKTMDDNDLVRSWTEWMVRTHNEIAHVYNSRDVFNQVRLMFDTNPAMFQLGTTYYTQSSQFVLSWLTRMYAVEVLMYIRREYDTQPNTQNLLKLLGEMETRPDLLSRGRYRRHFDAFIAPDNVKDGIVTKHFETFEIVEGAIAAEDHVSAEQVRKDRLGLEADIDTVREYANRDLAHRTQEWERPEILVPDHTDQALNAILGVFNRYYPLLTGKSVPNPTPIGGFEWWECLTHPLATPAYFQKVENDAMARRRAVSTSVVEQIGKNVRVITTS